jgi:hypothetical protein
LRLSVLIGARISCIFKFSWLVVLPPATIAHISFIVKPIPQEGVEFRHDKASGKLQEARGEKSGIMFCYERTGSQFFEFFRKVIQG